MREQPDPGPARDRTRTTVLVLDDSPHVLGILQDLLAAHGYDVLAADSPEAAIELAASDDRRIDLLLTDVVMPTMSGQEVASVLRERRPDLGVVYVSGYTAEHLEGVDLSDARTGFISKPFRSAQLDEALRRVLDGE